MSSISLPALAKSQPMKTDLTTLMFGNFFLACRKPTWRSVSAGTPAMPRISTTLPLPPIFLNSHSAPIRPYATWSFVTLCADGAVTRWSTETTLTPRALACAITELSALALDGLITMALAPAEIRLRMSAICSAGPPLRLATMTLLTTPLAFDCALIAQIISSRQPLPTSVLETPMTKVFFFAVGLADAVTALVIATAAIAVTAIAQRTALERTFMNPPPENCDADLVEKKAHAGELRSLPSSCRSNPPRCPLLPSLEDELSAERLWWEGSPVTKVSRRRAASFPSCRRVLRQQATGRAAV